MSAAALPVNVLITYCRMGLRLAPRHGQLYGGVENVGGSPREFGGQYLGGQFQQDVSPLCQRRGQDLGSERHGVFLECRFDFLVGSVGNQRRDLFHNGERSGNEFGCLGQGGFGLAGFEERNDLQDDALKEVHVFLLCFSNVGLTSLQIVSWPARQDLRGLDRQTGNRVEVAVQDHAVQAVADKAVVPFRLGQPVQVVGHAAEA